MRLRHFILLAITLTAALSTRTPAKRIAPPELKPIVLGDMEYRASTTRAGCIEAKDTKTQERWWRQIYVVAYDPGTEKDVQDVFIKELTAADGSLRIVNERGDEYTLNLKSLEVKVVKGSLMVKTGR